jgi:hypothetical protein
VSLTIYIGRHPSFFYRQYGFDESSAKKVSGQFLSEKVEWLTFNNKEKQIYLKEQKIPSNKIESGLTVHIAMLSNRDISIDELTKIVESTEIK